MFTLTVNANGSWTFDLQDQLDHVDNGLNDENLLLRTAVDGSTSVPSIDFSSIVVATDRDGDSARRPRAASRSRSRTTFRFRLRRGGGGSGGA